MSMADMLHVCRMQIWPALRATRPTMYYLQRTFRLLSGPCNINCYMMQKPPLPQHNVYMTLPSALVSLLQATFDIQTKWFASPINRHSSIPTYASCMESDRTCSVLYDAYACKWIGSGFVNPGLAAEDAFKAVRWAIASSCEDAPVFNVVIVPGSHVTPGMQAAMQHPCSCMHICSACMPNGILCQEWDPPSALIADTANRK